MININKANKIKHICLLLCVLYPIVYVNAMNPQTEKERIAETKTQLNEIEEILVIVDIPNTETVLQKGIIEFLNKSGLLKIMQITLKMDNHSFSSQIMKLSVGINKLTDDNIISKQSEISELHKQLNLLKTYFVESTKTSLQALQTNQTEIEKIQRYNQMIEHKSFKKI